MAKEVRKVYDYYDRDVPVFRLGYVRHLKAHSPLPLHNHANMIEIVYLERGKQKYRASGKDYIVQQGEVFFTLPNEFHDTGSVPEERSTLYYLIIDLALAEKMHLFASSDAIPQLTAQFSADSDRIFCAASNLSDAMKTLLKCFHKKAKDPYFDTHIRNALSEVFIALLTPHTPQKEEPLFNVSRSLQYIKEHSDEQIRVSTLSALEHTSISTYQKYFVKALGMPPGEYILRQKTELAKALLANTDLSVTEIAGRLGFSSGQYFATVFKRYCNETPTGYRKKHRRAASPT